MGWHWYGDTYTVWSTASTRAIDVDWHDDEPTLGVREPRHPHPPSLSGGAAADLHFTAEPEAEAKGRSVTAPGCVG